MIHGDVVAANRLEAWRLAIACTGLAGALVNRTFGEMAADAACHRLAHHQRRAARRIDLVAVMRFDDLDVEVVAERTCRIFKQLQRSEEHTSELQSLMRISYAVFCLKKKKYKKKYKINITTLIHYQYKEEMTIAYKQKIH